MRKMRNVHRYPESMHIYTYSCIYVIGQVCELEVVNYVSYNTRLTWIGKLLNIKQEFTWVSQSG